jgi:putative RecB family exonuclease
MLLSHSSISTYEQCPLKWKLHYIDRVPEMPKPFFTFGTVMHDVMEFFYMEKDGGKVKGPRFKAPSVEELLRYYAAIWSSEGYEDAQQEENYRKLGEKIIKEYHEEHAPKFHMPIATEQYFRIDVNGIGVRGYIDRVDKLGPDSVGILDYKTSKNQFTLPQVEKNEQLALYQMAFEELYGKRVERLTLYHLRSNMDFSVGRRPKEMIDALRDKIIRVAESIEAENFEPKKSNLCKYCDYQHLCPYFMDLYAEKTEEKMGIEEMVEEYARLSDEVSRLKKRREELAEILKSYAEERGLRAIFGRTSAITVSVYDRISYEEGAREILESAGLWNMVSSLDSKKLRNLLDSDIISPELKADIEKYRKVKRVMSLRKRKMRDDEIDVS